MDYKPTHLDLFSGIGGFALAARWAGFETVAFCENEPFCQKVLAKHWPEVYCFDDICTLAGDALRRRGIRGVDLATGGFPCQDLSLANKTGKGLQGKRSGLWFEMLRVIEQVGPTFVVVENVPNLYNMGIDICLAGLEAVGYTVRTLGIPACGVGGWHKRQRVFIIGAYTDRMGVQSKKRATGTKRSLCHDEIRQYSMAQQSREHILYWTGPHATCDEFEARGETQVFRLGQSSGQYRGMDEGFGERSRLFEPKLCGDIHGISDGIHRLRALGNAIVPQVVYPILMAIYDELVQMNGDKKGGLK